MFSRAAPLALALGAFFAPGQAAAQACCAGASVVAPGRLKFEEQRLVGLELRGHDALGTFTPAGDYEAAPSGASELGFQQTLFAGTKLFDEGQLVLAVPLVQTRRAGGGLAETGGGLGDVTLSGRWDLTFAGNVRHRPGFALLASATAPTGTPVDAAKKPLATDATGAGAWQGALGASVEQVHGSFFWLGLASLAGRTPRTVQGIREQLGPQLTVTLAGGYALGEGGGVALTLTHLREPDATVGGRTAAGSGRAATTLGAAFGYGLSARWRVQASLYDELPIGGLGKNGAAGVGATLSVLRAWL